VQDRVVNPNLTDVMQDARVAKRGQFVSFKAHLPAEKHGVLSYSLGMAATIPIPGVNGGTQGLNGGDVQRIDALKQPRVMDGHRQLMGQGLDGHLVIFGEAVELCGLNIKDSQYLASILQAGAHLRLDGESIPVARVFANVIGDNGDSLLAACANKAAP